MYADDSILCCLFPYKCDSFRQALTPAPAATPSDATWHVKVAAAVFSAFLVVWIVWHRLWRKTAHRTDTIDSKIITDDDVASCSVDELKDDSSREEESSHTDCETFGETSIGQVNSDNNCGKKCEHVLRYGRADSSVNPSRPSPRTSKREKRYRNSAVRKTVDDDDDNIISLIEKERCNLELSELSEANIYETVDDNYRANSHDRPFNDDNISRIIMECCNVELPELSEEKICETVYDDKNNDDDSEAENRLARPGDDDISRIEKVCCVVELSEFSEKNIRVTADDADDDGDIRRVEKECCTVELSTLSEKIIRATADDGEDNNNRGVGKDDRRFVEIKSRRDHDLRPRLRDLCVVEPQQNSGKRRRRNADRTTN